MKKVILVREDTYTHITNKGVYPKHNKGLLEIHYKIIINCISKQLAKSCWQIRGKPYK